MWHVHPGSRIPDPDPDFFPIRDPGSGSRIQGSQKHRIPDLQHCPAYFLTREHVPAYYLDIRSFPLQISWHEKPVSAYCLRVRSISLHILIFLRSLCLCIFLWEACPCMICSAYSKHEKPVSMRIIFLWLAYPCIFLKWEPCVCVLSACEKLVPA